MDPLLIKVAIKVIMSMKKIVCAISVRLAVSNESLFHRENKTTNVHLKPLVLQEQLINHFGLKVLSTACEVVPHGDKWDNSDWTLNLTDSFMIQFDMGEELHIKGSWCS